MIEILAAIAIQSAVQQEAPRPPQVIVTTSVSWAQRPQAEFPALALSEGIMSGEVGLVCVVGGDGRPQNCSILFESPADAGFGQAALRAMTQAKFSPSTVAGVVAGGQARFTVTFIAREG